MPEQAGLEQIARDVLDREAAAGADDLAQTERAVRAVTRAQAEADPSTALAIVQRVKRGAAPGWP